MMADIVITALVVGSTIPTVWVGGRIVWTAIRTGRLLARGAVYDRDTHPVRYFVGIISLVLLMSWMVGLSLFVLAHAFRT